MSSYEGKGSLFPSDRNRSRDDSPHRSNDADRTRPRTVTNQSSPTNNNIMPGSSVNHNYSYSQSQDQSARKVSYRQAFILIDFDDFETCARLIKQYPIVLREDTNAYQEAAIQYYHQGDNIAAERCIQRLVLLKCCSKLNDDPAVDYVMSLQFRGRERKQFEEYYDKFKQAIISYGSSTSPVSRPSAPQLTLPANVPSNQDLVHGMQGLNMQDRQPRRMSHVQPRQESYSKPSYYRQYSQEESSSARTHQQVVPMIEEREPEPVFARDSYGNLTATGSQKLQIRGAQTRSLNNKYWVRTRPDDFFTFGKIFKVLWHQPAGADTNGQVNKGNHTFGYLNEPIHSSLRWMMVVVPKHGYCICCPISTYSQKGLGEKSLSDTDVKAHAILHADDSQPCYVRGEPKGLITKDPIAVQLVPGVHSIDPASRVHFGKCHTVEYNVKVMEIGRVISKDRPKVESYFAREFAPSR